MAVLDKLTLTAATPKKDNSPLGRFRRRLIEALGVQIDIANADITGTVYTRSRQKWIRNAAGYKELCGVSVRFKRWWGKDDAGKTFLSLRGGVRLLEIAPGKKAIDIGTTAELPHKLLILREAVCARELDSCSTVRDIEVSNGNNEEQDKTCSGLLQKRQLQEELQRCLTSRCNLWFRRSSNRFAPVAVFWGSDPLAP